MIRDDSDLDRYPPELRAQLTMIADDCDRDLDHLPPDQRAMRLENRRKIEASIAHIGETDGERRSRERYEAKRAGFLARQQAPQQAAEAEQRSVAWTNFINSRFNEAIETADKIGQKILEGVGASVSEQRMQRRAELAEESERLGRKLRSESAARAADGEARATELETKLAEVQAANTRSRGEAREETGELIADAVAVERVEREALRSELETKFAASEKRAVAGEARMEELETRLPREIEAAAARAREETRELIAEAVSKAITVERAERKAENAASERRIEASGARAQKLEAELIELQAQTRDSAMKMVDDLQQRDHDVAKVDKAVAGLRAEIGDKLSALREHMADAENRPAFDQVQVGRIVEAAVRQARSDMRAHVEEAVDKAVAAARTESDAKIEAMKEDMLSRAGRLPVAKVWTPDTAALEGELYARDGATYQARQTTGQPPPGSHWICLAGHGQDGRDGLSISFRSVFDASEAYAVNDIVVYEGQAFIAVRSNPTGVPSDSLDWRLCAARGVKGERGQPGLRGHKGDRGPQGDPAPTLHHWEIDAPNYRVIGVLTDGAILPALSLGPLFELFQQQTSE